MRVNTYAEISIAFQEIVELGDRWHSRGLPGPTNSCIKASSRVFNQLWEGNGLFPYRVSQSALGGIHADFEQNGFRVALELYNEGDGAVIIKEGNLSETFDIPAKNRESVICNIITKILLN